MKKLEADILKILEEDCRYSPSKIAVMLDTSEAEVSAAIKNMEESGVIVKYTAIVNGEALSEEIVQALIEVRVTPQKVNGFDAIAEEIYRFDEVQSLYLMRGGYDQAVLIEGRSLRRVAFRCRTPVHHRRYLIHGDAFHPQKIQDRGHDRGQTGRLHEVIRTAMKDFLNQRVKDLKPSGIRKFFDIVSEMKGAISLGVGEPDFITPWHIRNAAIRSVQRGYTQYTGNRGIPKLRELISRYLFERFSVSYPADNVIVTVGASEGIDLVLRAICEVGDDILVPEPSYVSYFPCVHLSGANAVPVKCVRENGFIVTPEMLESSITPRTKAIILPYPNNPTGGIMTKEQLEAIVPVIVKHDLLVISDEIYAELTYGGKHVSVASFEGMRERTVLISGFSKAFAMTGWRIGFVCAPPEIDKALFKIHQYVIMCAPTNSQYAAIEALEEGFTDNFSVVETMRAEYDKRRRFMVDFFNGCGLRCFEPRGAFYVFPSVESLQTDGEAFANGLLRAEKVAVVPGNAFGDAGRFHVRCSYATSMANLSEAASRIGKYLDQVKKG